MQPYLVLAVAALLLGLTLSMRATASSTERPAKSAKGQRNWGFFVLAIPIAFSLYLASLSTALPEPGACTAKADQPAVPAGTPTIATKSLKIKDPAATRISLGSDKGPANAAIVLEMDPQKTLPTPRQVPVSVDSLRRGDNPDVSVAVSSHAAFTTSSNLTVWICIERARAGSFVLDPGEYAGSVTVVDPRLPATTIPFSITLSYTNWPVVLICWSLVVLVGAGYVFVIRNEPASPSTPSLTDRAPLNIAEVARFMSSPLGLASTVTGGAAALGVYASAYLGSATWGASTSDWLTLTGAMFGAFVTASTAFRFANVVSNPPASSGGGSAGGGPGGPPTGGKAGTGTGSTGATGTGTAPDPAVLI